MPMRSRLTALGAASAVVAGCSIAIAGPVSAATQLPTYARVVLVVEENRTASDIIGDKSAPFINSLAAGGALMAQSFAVTHPSEPNYLAIFAGDTFGLGSNACPLNFGNAPNLASELIAAGYTFGGYAEGLPAAGSSVCSAGKYARKHAPWLNFTNVPASVSLPMSAFTGDGTLPTVSVVVPDLNNDMHDGSVAAGDSWLETHLSGYANWAKANNGLLIVTWDEDDESGNNQVPTIFYGAGIRPGTYEQQISHYNVLSTIEQIYGLPKTGLAASAPAIAGIWSGG